MRVQGNFVVFFLTFQILRHLLRKHCVDAISCTKNSQPIGTISCEDELLSYFGEKNTIFLEHPVLIRRPFLNIENIPDLVGDDWEGKIIGNIDFKYISNRVSFMGNLELDICLSGLPFWMH